MAGAVTISLIHAGSLATPRHIGSSFSSGE